ncbi:hypothetical protein A3L04_01190 [Thermococcus chitonophagus]|uniref:Transcription regulator TrmB C-terminal domain-containing protein n=1 Tax=Thermococcus chitonophagus TaxID=54262 RepID=A0A160VTT1_9EURY|nr:TrmB family transcriptional regulator sugar-binding domain-containing protein [Thermococcus chitonophagus]ASJ15782.1 hypothetical protein A3L04_01190 [Thermococcus chitonophagus]CUX77011.1 hypothetical protein CHITON_0232 [Thermococcus chitonophagus]
MDRVKLALMLVILMGIIGIVITKSVVHYQGGEIYEAANEIMNLLAKGFNVTVEVETVDGKIVKGEAFAAKGSEITIIVNGSRVTVGGPSATKEEIKAKVIRVIYHGKVYVYEFPGTQGYGRDILRNFLTGKEYSVRFSGRIYIKNISIIELGKLKYLADYMSYGSITINGIYGDSAIITANYVPVQLLEEELKNKEIFIYGILYVNSESRTLPLKIIEVRSP